MPNKEFERIYPLPNKVGKPLTNLDKNKNSLLWNNTPPGNSAITPPITITQTFSIFAQRFIGEVAADYEFFYLVVTKYAPYAATVWGILFLWNLEIIKSN